MAGRKERFGPSGFEQWGGYMGAKKQKLSHQFQEQMSQELNFAESSRIFEGISIFINGYTNPSAEELKRLMMLHGGTFHHYYSRKATTHIIATNLPNSKIQQLKDEKVVKPEWITESIAAKKLLPDRNYLLYNLSKDQKLLNFDKKIINDESSMNKEPLTNNECLENTEMLENLDSDKFQNSNFVVNSLSKCEEKSLLKEDNTMWGKNIEQPNKDFKHEFLYKTHNESKSTMKAGNPNFLSEFYSHSRLHHIATAKSDFQTYVSQLRNRPNKKFPGLDTLKNLYLKNQEASLNKLNHSISSKVYMHLDMDCFFVSVSLLNYPHLKGKPVAVTHSRTGVRQPVPGSNVEYEYQYYKENYKKNINENRQRDFQNNDVSENENWFSFDTGAEYGSMSEIASCSYEARKYGICNGCFLGEAKKLCPDLQTVPYDFINYERVSKLLYDIVTDYTLNIQAISCDEMFIDCTSVLSETGISPLEFAAVLRKEIENKTNCTASAGLGRNLLLARLATKTAKPNGQYFIETDMIDDFMAKQPVKDLPGVGHALKYRLESMNIKTCEDLQLISIGKLQDSFGSKTGRMLYEYCRGNDNREIKTNTERKSVSAEINYGMRFEKMSEVKSFLKELSEEVQNRLQKINKRGKAVTLKIKIRKKGAPIEPAKFMGHGICDNITKTLQLASTTNNSISIHRACVVLLQNLQISPEDIRGLGIQVGRLEEGTNKNADCNNTLLNFVQKSTEYSKKLLKNSINDSNHTRTNISLLGIDPEVFACLSKEIQNEVIESYKNKNFTILNANSEPEHYDNPTTSNSFDVFQNDYRKSNIHQDFNLPNFSQIDQSVFNALPNELKQEIMAAYNKSEKIPIKSDFQSPPKKSKSPNKIISPNKSPEIKGKKGTNKVIKKSNEKNLQKKLTVQAITDCVSETETVTKYENPIEPNLCGATSLDEIKSLFTEWVSSSLVPEKEDITVFENYMIQVVMEKNLEKLSRIIKFLYRSIKKINSVYWQKFYLDLVSSVQSSVIDIYGSILKIDTDF